MQRPTELNTMNCTTVNGAAMGGAGRGGGGDDDDESCLQMRGDGWATGLFQFLSEDAGSALDWGYVCTACACPCVQFYINWKKMLTGAPEQRFYCLSGPCCECSDSVHACCQTVCCVAFYPLISLKEGRQLDAKPFRGGDIVPLPSWRRCFKSCGIPLRKRDERLLVAAREGDLQKCQELLRNGANINARDGNLVTPIMGAATYGRLETADFLIKQRANINAQDRIGATAVVKASQKGHFETVFLLWNSGANVRTTDSYGQSAYDYAIGETKNTLRAILRIKEHKQLTMEEMIEQGAV